MLPLQASIWDIAVLRTEAILAGTHTATLIVTRIATRTVTLIVTHTAIRTEMDTLVVEDIRRTTVTRSVTLTDETVETGERGVARPQQEAVGVGIVPLRALGAGAVTVGRHPVVVGAVRRNLHPLRRTMADMHLFRLRRMLMEGGEPLKWQKIKSEPVFHCNQDNVQTTTKVTGKKEDGRVSLSSLFQFHKISQVSMMPSSRLFSLRAMSSPPCPIILWQEFTFLYARTSFLR